MALRPLFCLYLSDCLRQVSLYMYMYILCPVLYVYKITDDFVSKIYTNIYFYVFYTNACTFV